MILTTISLAIRCDGKHCRRCGGACWCTWPNMGSLVETGTHAETVSVLEGQADAHGWLILPDEHLCPDCFKGSKVKRESPAAAPQVAAKFVGVGKTVMRGGEFIANAVSHTMALRIANALNKYKPNERGF